MMRLGNIPLFFRSSSRVLDPLRPAKRNGLESSPHSKDASGSGRMASLLSMILLGVIRLYQRLISPLLPRSCRFYPSCSSYAVKAIGQHGPWRGVLLTFWRLARCHPFNPGGYDPVPEQVRSGTESPRG